MLATAGTTIASALDVRLSGFWIGGPPGIAAVTLARHSCREHTSPQPTRSDLRATTAITALALAQLLHLTAVSLAA